MRRVRILVNALAMHAASDGARTFLEQLIQKLPEVWPDADFHAVVSDARLITPVRGMSVTRIRTWDSGTARVMADLALLPSIADRLRADVVVSPNESAPTRLPMPFVVVAQNVLFHCQGVGPLPTGSPLARLRSQLQFSFYRRHMPKVYRRADAVVCVSRHAANTLARHARLDLGRVTVVPCGADALPLRERQAADARPVILAVGAVAHFKRLATAVEALARLRRAGADYELVLAGEEWPGYGRVIDELAQSAGVATAVKRLGGVPAGRLAELFSTAHATIALSVCESFGIPVVEAMRAGVPAVVADEPWSRELVGDAAIKVDGRSPDAVVAAVRALENHDEWQRRSAEGRRLAAHYTWERTARGIADVVAAVLRQTAERKHSAET